MIVEKDKSYRPNIPINNLYNKITTKIIHKKKLDVSTEIEDAFFSEPIIPSKRNIIKSLVQPKVKIEIVKSNSIVPTDVSSLPHSKSNIEDKSEPYSASEDDLSHITKEEEPDKDMKTSIVRLPDNKNMLELDIYKVKEDILDKEVNEDNKAFRVAQKFIHNLKIKNNSPKSPTNNQETGFRMRTLSD